MSIAPSSFSGAAAAFFNPAMEAPPAGKAADAAGADFTRLLAGALGPRARSLSADGTPAARESAEEVAALEEEDAAAESASLEGLIAAAMVRGQVAPQVTLRAPDDGVSELDGFAAGASRYDRAAPAVASGDEAVLSPGVAPAPWSSPVSPASALGAAVPTVAAGAVAGAMIPAAEARTNPGVVVPGPEGRTAPGAPAAGNGATAGPSNIERRPEAPVDPRRVERGMERLDPEFRSRLTRVVERMRAEHGHEVKVVETLRPQERQDFLYEQGRTRSGPVVTWTRSSNHTRGRAADVMIDGTYNNPKGYARLAEVAVEEGLRTLGPKDPGHVELPRGSRALPSLAGPLEPVAPDVVQEVRSPSQVTSPAESNPQPTAQARSAASAGPMERGLARVAEVAEVARVASVARVAQVAQVTQVSPSSRTPAVGSASPTRQDANSRGGSESKDSARPGIDATLLRADSAMMPTQLSASPLEPVSVVGGADAASRLAQIMEIRDGASSGSIDHVLLRLDNGSGGQDVIRVDLRGSAVGASIDLANAGEVDQMLARLPELQRTLERQGLEAEQLKIRSAATAISEAAEIIRTVSVPEADLVRGGAGGRTGSDSPSSRDRWESATHGQSRRDTDDPRQQSRRNPKGDNKP